MRWAALFLAILAGGCRRPPMVDGPDCAGVSVVPVDVEWPGLRLEGRARKYGPGIGLEGVVGPMAGGNRLLFEVVNGRATAVDWVVWDYGYTLHTRSITPRGSFGPYLTHRVRERLGCQCPLPPGGAAMFAVDLRLPTYEDWVIGGEVLSCLAGSGRGGPRPGLTAERYHGPEWLAPRGKFVRERLGAELDRLRAGGAGEADGVGRALNMLVEASRRANGGVPVVRNPGLVDCIAQLTIAAAPRTAMGPEARPRDVWVGSVAVPVLLDLVPPDEIRRHAEGLGALAVHAGEVRVAELLVKAGSAGALKELAAHPERLPLERRADFVLAARAACGEAEAFAEMLAGLAARKDEARRVSLGRLLALLGREPGLRALAGEFRGGREDSRYVRGELVAALRLALPGERALYTSVEATDEELAAAEEFCAGRFGAAPGGR